MSRKYPCESQIRDNSGERGGTAGAASWRARHAQGGFASAEWPYTINLLSSK